MSRTSAATLPPLCGSRPAASRRARVPRPTDRSLGRLQRADDRRHHRDLGAGPDPDARRLDVQFDRLRGRAIRRFALNAAVKRLTPRSDASTTTGANGRSPIILLSLSTRLPTPGDQLLLRQTMATRDLADHGAALEALRDDRRLLLSRPNDAAVPRP